MKRSVLVVHPSIDGVGGSDQVAAWTLQALSEEFDVTVVSWSAIDPDVVDEFCSTELQGVEIEYRHAPRLARASLDLVPGRLALIRVAFLLRLTRRLDRAERFDCVVSTFNEMDFGRQGVQYIHYPWSYLPRPASEMGRFTRLPGVLALYHALCRAVGRMSKAGIAANISIANSAFVAAKVTEMTGRPCQVMFPPVPGDFEQTPWRSRRDEIVCVGRLAPEKRTLSVVDIVEGVRARGFDLRLRLVGIPEDAAYTARVEERAAASPDWICLEVAPPRGRLLQIMREARYGIHAMQNEHFGIVIAEMVLSGCIVFAHASGGPMEILGEETDLLFCDDEGAVARIAAAMESDPLRERLREHLQGRRELFGVDGFVRGMRSVVRDAVNRA